MDKYYIGIDIGGTKCAVVLADESCDIIDKVIFLTETDKGVKYALTKIKEAVHYLIDNFIEDVNKIQSVGISCGGPLDSIKGLILSPPNLPGWSNIAIVDIMEKEFNIATYLQNDANACALAEWKFGAGKGYKNVIFLTFGTGMGAGLILDGRPYVGACDMAGEIGHIRISENGPVGYGKIGSFEGFCSGGGIAQIAKNYVLKELQKGNKVSFCNGIKNLEEINAQVVAEAAFKGDTLAKQIYQEVGKYLGKGLSILIDMLNPEAIVIGSIYTRSCELMKTSMETVLREEVLPQSLSTCKILPAKLGENLGDIAAICVGMEGVRANG